MLIIHKPSLWSRDVPQKNVGPIGSAVLTFIGYKQTYKQTNKQTDKPNLYIDEKYTLQDPKMHETPKKLKKLQTQIF